MESKSINRYNTFCRSLKNLEKSRTADVESNEGHFSERDGYS